MENNKDLISVIVPIYNVEQYLKRSLDSILKQTYKNIEVVLINDGSTDKSRDICEEYQKKDKRVKLINKKNEGVAIARNTGLENSSGNFITFVDSDDVIELDYIECLYNVLLKTKSDISICSFFDVYDEKYICEKKETVIKEFNVEEALESLLYENEVDASPWAKLFKKDLFENINFGTYRKFEDFATIYKLIMKCNKICYINQKKYYYYHRNNSLMRNKFSESNLDVLEINKDMNKEIIKVYPNMYLALNNRMMCTYFYLIRNIDKKKYKLIYNEAIDFIKKNRKEIFYNKNIGLKSKAGIIISYVSFDLIKPFFKIKNFIDFAKVKLIGRGEIKYEN